ncbi:MAG: hypothetical protein OEL57_15610 [Trichlorobacter sp.]|uniref:hypothetical protein n=1 Tax=Trichlorobacter sp. TaxID=2911007 RepID=UPI00256DF61A|nr:hypothetical protein [Trichlorobacter sp.]MDK9719308.1 hypothetical protein [Trichlorobacter sp.]
MTNRAKTFGNKRQLAVIITVATFFFVFLGMRIPYIKGDFHKPKQRPRAVAENILKAKETAAQQNLKKHHADGAVIINFPFQDANPEVAVKVKPVVTQLFYTPKPTSKQSPPRAPPLYFI